MRYFNRDDSPVLKRGASRDESQALSSQGTNILCSIEVSIKLDMTARTIEYPKRQGHGLPMSAGAACLTRIGRIDFHQGLFLNATALAFEAGIAAFLCSFTHAAEECLESKINAYRNVLQHLGMHDVKPWPFLFQHPIGALLLKARQVLAFLFIGNLPAFKQMVVEPPAFFQCLTKPPFLLLRWVDAILKHLIKHVDEYMLNPNSCQGRGYPNAQAPHNAGALRRGLVTCNNYSSSRECQRRP